MRIKLQGGYVETTDETWAIAGTNEVRPFWRAFSEHDASLASELFYTRELAEFSVWVIHERVASENSRRPYR